MRAVPRKNRGDTQASLELLYHVSREIATAIDLPTLLERVLFLSMENIGAISGSIIALDDTGSPAASALIVDDHAIGYSPDQLQATLDQGLAGWVVRNREAVLIPDTGQDERWLRRPDDAEEATGAKSAVSVPFLAQERLVGVITLVHPIPGFFSQEHLDLVRAIADQSAVGVLNARMLADSRRQARIMTALADSATAITGALHLDDVLQRILGQISLVLETEAVSLALIDRDGENLKYYASTSKGKQSVVGKTIRLGQGIAGWVAKEQTGVIVNDVYKDPRFYRGMDQETGFKTRAIACAPIYSEGKVIGITEAINPVRGAFTADALLVLNGISSLAGSAIRHATLFEALQAAHKGYHDLFEGSINSIIITDWQGRILEANQQTAALSKYDEKQLNNLSIDAVHDVNCQILGTNFEKIPREKTLSYESTLHTQSGTEVPITVHVQSVNVSGDSFLQWAFRDDSERKELDRLREDLLSMIYHDLRSPLANVVSSLDVLNMMADFNDNPAIQSLFDIAVRSTERIQRLTNSLLDLNRLEAGQPVVDTSPVNPRDLVTGSIEAVKPIIENKRINLILEIPEDMDDVMVDGDMIQRVLINIVENAIKFTPQEGTIQVGVSQDGEWVRMWVEDTGPGIPAKKRSSIFDKYTRLHGKSGPKGFGLGLAYCRLAVEGHGGEIWIEDASIGGSHFSFTLPVASDAQTQVEKSN